MQFPKIIHFYWGKNQPLSYLRYLSVKSFHILNPDWQIKLWTPEHVSRHITWHTGEQAPIYQGEDYFPRLSEFVTVLDVHGHDLPPDFPEVHKSDLFRWQMLAQYGGVWSDIDILYVKSIDDALLCELNSGPVICRYNPTRKSGIGVRHIATGFLSCGKNGNRFFEDVFDFGLSRIQNTDYQAFGPSLLKEYLEINWNRQVYNLDPVVVYPYSILEDWKRYWEPGRCTLPEKTIGCHWYAGHPFSAEREAQICECTLEKMAGRYMICQQARQFHNK
jgi:hypothetical protein